MKCDGTRAETRFHLSVKRTSPFKSVGASVQSTSGSLSVRISGSNAGYTMFRGNVKSTGYPLQSPYSPSLLLQGVAMCHHISNAVYYTIQTTKDHHLRTSINTFYYSNQQMNTTYILITFYIPQALPRFDAYASS